jgi:predicted nucleic acid-binding protein
MRYLLDTDTSVYWLRGRVSVQERMQAVGPEKLVLSVITLAELRYGAACSTQPEANHKAIDDLVSALSILGVDPEIAQTFGNIKAQLRQEGRLIEDLDLMIAATARVYDLTLVTNNLAHFGRVPGLRLENWVGSLPS